MLRAPSNSDFKQGARTSAAGTGLLSFCADVVRRKFWSATPFLFRQLAAVLLSVLVGGAVMAQSQKWSEQNFSKPSAEELKKKLSSEQFDVTQKSGTERPFANKYWDHKEEGIYVDLVSGEPLFSSKDKYDSGTGWPSFTQPIDKSLIVTKSDYKIGVERTEIRSKNADSHLGHVFNDGPGPTGERYCTNSASLRFIPKDKLEEEGYGEYLKLFEN